MSASETALFSLLFEEGRKLENLKFFPGDTCASEEELFDAAHTALRMDLNGKGVEAIPSCAKQGQPIGDLVKSL